MEKQRLKIIVGLVVSIVALAMILMALIWKYNAMAISRTDGDDKVQVNQNNSAKYVQPAPVNVPSVSPGSSNDTSTTTLLSQTNNRTIDNGFVFYEGRYIEAPYHITFDGKIVRINGLALAMGVPSEPVPSPQLEKGDPGPPPNLTAMSGFDDLFPKTGKENRAHMYREWSFIVAKTPRAEAPDKMIAYLKNLPPVANVYYDADGIGGDACFTVKMRNGEQSTMGMQ